MKTAVLDLTSRFGLKDEDLDVIACRFAGDNMTQQDILQEMLLHLLSMSPGKRPGFYFRALERCAYTYWANRILDAPLGSCSRPILERQTVAVGGLAELDRIHRRMRAA